MFLRFRYELIIIFCLNCIQHLTLRLYLVLVSWLPYNFYFKFIVLFQDIFIETSRDNVVNVIQVFQHGSFLFFRETRNYHYNNWRAFLNAKSNVTTNYEHLSFCFIQRKRKGNLSFYYVYLPVTFIIHSNCVCNGDVGAMNIQCTIRVVFYYTATFGNAFYLLEACVWHLGPFLHESGKRY